MRFLMLSWRDPKNPKGGGAERVSKAYLAELVRRGTWDPFAFVDACEAAAREKNERQRLLRELQAVESELLLEWFGRQS